MIVMSEMESGSRMGHNQEVRLSLWSYFLEFKVSILSEF